MSEQEALEIEIIADRREQAEAAYDSWRRRIAGVDSDDEAILATLLMKRLWFELTEALDRRLRRLP